MSGVDENDPLIPAEGRLRIAIAWLSWLLILVGCGLALAYLLIFISFLAIGGVELVSGVLAGQEKTAPMHTRIILVALFIGWPPGAILGVRLWARLMRRMGWISAERIKRMSGF
ncbi:hypothetical protein [Methyloversatilis thermotolerans]|uniref:hypothetical protein n=1 Tax=Methyloversatilis thermotolerans TaxID=1346290 RepID=UPI000373F2A7|nr:hypothetical protein [Methyloversatilis thermotolerans]